MKILDLFKENVLIFYLISLFIGFVLHNFSSKLENAIPILVGIQMFFSTFKIELNQFVNSLKKIKNNIAVLIIHFILLPIILLFLSMYLFRSNELVVAGIVFIFTLPSAVTNIFFSNLFKGNTNFVLSIVLISSIISPIATPLVFYLLTKNIVRVDFLAIFLKIMLIVVLPLILSNFAKKLSMFNHVKENSDSYASISFVLFSFIAAGIIFNSEILRNYNLLFSIIIFLTAIFVLLFLAIFLISKKIVNDGYAISNALLLMRRNTGMGIGIAIGSLNSVTVVLLILYGIIMDIFGLAFRRLVK